MAITAVTESHVGRDGFSSQLSRRGYTRHFTVTTNDPYTTKIVVERATDPNTGLRIPQPYEFYQTPTEFDTKALVRLVRPRQRDNSRLMWDVFVDYDTEFEPFENPFTEPPVLEFDTETFDQPLPGAAATFYDTGTPASQSEDPSAAGLEVLVAWGAGITTSAGEPFDPPAVVQRVRPVVRFVHNVPFFLMADKVKWENSVNKTPWNGLQARQAWCRKIGVSYHLWRDTSTTTPDVPYARVSWEFAIKAETWDLFLLDIGSYYLDYSSGSAVRKAFEVEGTGQPRLGLLDHTNQIQLGKKLAAGEDAQFLRFRAFREEEFNNLGINLNLALEFIRTRRRTR